MTVNFNEELVVLVQTKNGENKFFSYGESVSNLDAGFKLSDVDRSGVFTSSKTMFENQGVRNLLARSIQRCGDDSGLIRPVLVDRSYVNGYGGISYPKPHPVLVDIGYVYEDGKFIESK